MADKKPLLMEELTSTEQVLLASLKQHPAYSVLEKLFMTACKRANESVIQVDPEDPRYDQIVKARQIKARERNEFFLLVFQSIEWHVQAAAISAEEQNREPEQNRITKGMDQ